MYYPDKFLILYYYTMHLLCNIPFVFWCMWFWCA